MSIAGTDQHRPRGALVEEIAAVRHGSERYGELLFDLRAVGCSPITVQVWDTSPLLPAPVRPAAG